MLTWPHSGFHIHTAVWVPEEDRAAAAPNPNQRRDVARGTTPAAARSWCGTRIAAALTPVEPD